MPQPSLNKARSLSLYALLERFFQALLLLSVFARAQNRPLAYSVSRPGQPFETPVFLLGTHHFAAPTQSQSYAFRWRLNEFLGRINPKKILFEVDFETLKTTAGVEKEIIALTFGRNATQDCHGIQYGQLESAIFQKATLYYTPYLFGHNLFQSQSPVAQNLKIAIKDNPSLFILAQSLLTFRKLPSVILSNREKLIGLPMLLRSLASLDYRALGSTLKYMLIPHFRPWIYALSWFEAHTQQQDILQKNAYLKATGIGEGSLLNSYYQNYSAPTLSLTQKEIMEQSLLLETRDASWIPAIALAASNQCAPDVLEALKPQSSLIPQSLALYFQKAEEYFIAIFPNHNFAQTHQVFVTVFHQVTGQIFVQKGFPVPDQAPAPLNAATKVVPEPKRVEINPYSPSAAQPSILFAFGAMHLQGVIENLEKEGYKATPAAF